MRPAIKNCHSERGEQPGAWPGRTPAGIMRTLNCPAELIRSFEATGNGCAKGIINHAAIKWGIFSCSGLMAPTPSR